MERAFPVGEERLSWHEWASALALVVAARGDCLRDKVGAVIMDPDHRIVAVGYNGVASGELGCSEGGCDRCSDPNVVSGEGYEQCLCIHAEMNALIYAGRDRCKGSTLYVTREPCGMCRKVIQASGIARTIVV